VSIYSDATQTVSPLSHEAVDSYPFYWDEPINSRFESPHTSSPSALIFGDQPETSALLLGDLRASNSFVTRLVGVGPTRSLIPLSPTPTLTWQSNAVVGGSGGVHSVNLSYLSTAGAMSIPGTPGDIFNFNLAPPATSGGVFNVSLDYRYPAVGTIVL